MRTRWPGFAAFHSGHMVVEFTIAVWRRLRPFALCVECHPAVARSYPAADPLADAVSRRAGRLGVVPRSARGACYGWKIRRTEEFLNEESA